MHTMFKTSQKWLTVAIFQKWQDSTVALWIEISVILITGDRDWRFGMVWLVWGGEGQITSKFIHEEISIMDYDGLSGGGFIMDYH